MTFQTNLTVAALLAAGTLLCRLRQRWHKSSAMNGINAGTHIGTMGTVPSGDSTCTRTIGTTGIGTRVMATGVAGTDMAGTETTSRTDASNGSSGRQLDAPPT
jgi:hypothetical protein